MTQIILVSNGNTRWDKDKIFQGSKDIPLDDLGREEAWAVGKWLKDVNIHAVYTSPLSRARDTAITIARHHDLKVLDMPGLVDLSYGDWNGVRLQEVKFKYADLYRQWETAPHTVCFPNGEPLAVLRTRALAAVEEVVQRHPDRTVLLMAHRAVNKIMIAAFIGLDNSNFWRIAQETTAINRFHLVEDGRRVGKAWHITSINETGHLRGIERGHTNFL
jgi:phosphoserine phosphatase